ncbi:MAG: hypothetical protein B7X40_06960 [Cellulomonas sp. 14-74-6]|nr:MAG: hypothetical protein B7X40_06960 [Cellulomonas sp. 14-74-6]
MLILAVVSVAVIGVIFQTQALGASNRSRVAAANLASRELDLVRQEFAASTSAPVTLANAGLVTDPHPLSGGVAGSPLVVDGTAYTVERSAQWNVTGTGASACEGGSLVPYPTLEVTVTVTWPNMGSVRPVVLSGALAPDKNAGTSSTNSFVAAKVLDQAAHPLSGVAVSAAAASTATGYTDASGCAVIPITPAAAGTSYTVTVADSGYVDMSDTVNPSKTTGLITPGSLYSGASFSVAQPGTVVVKLVRSDGQPLTDAQVAGSSISLVAAEYSGASGTTSHTVTGVSTTITGLWPTSYGAYFGPTPPTGGYDTADLAPGGSVALTATFEIATMPLTALPAGTTTVVAVPAGASTSCSPGDGTTLAVTAPSSQVTLMPGTYDLYASGTGFACSPGPTGVALGGGVNDTVTWGTTTLQLSGVPSGGTVWALNSASSGVTSLATCPGATGSSALNIDAARSGPTALPAGTWFVYQTNGSATASCTSYPGLIDPVNVLYGQANSRAWSVAPLTASLTLTGMNNGQTLLVSTAPVSNCTSSSYTTTGTAATGSVAGWSGSANATVNRPPATPNLTYYAYQWNTSMWSPKCTAAGSFIVGPGTTSLSKSVTQSTVGP